MNPDDQRIFELKAALFFLVLLLFVLGTYSDRKIRENRVLKQGLELLKENSEDTRQQNLARFDSLQGIIREREQAQQQLKDSLLLLEGKRNSINKRSDEKKAAISRIADVDSLYREVAGHYR